MADLAAFFSKILYFMCHLFPFYRNVGSKNHELWLDGRAVYIKLYKICYRSDNVWFCSCGDFDWKARPPS